MKFNAQQQHAIRCAKKWVQDESSPQVFKIFGYAGTGKTTLAKHLAENINGHVYFAAFTGKAAYVLQQKGCEANTIHQLIYNPKSKSSQRLKDLKDELKTVEEGTTRYRQLERDIKAEKENLARPSFQLNLDSVLNSAALCIIDEVSMVNADMANDLLSFGCKILVLGDPAQLPPVFGIGYFLQGEPDIMLTEITRQAADSPIIHLASMVRNHEFPNKGKYGESSVILPSEFNAEIALSAEQLIVATNNTRRSFNGRIRELLNREGKLPNVDDRIVCLRNNHEEGLLNGAIWIVTHVIDDAGDIFLMSIRPEESQQNIDTLAHKAIFEGVKLEWWARQDANEFDYGYALTCHKSQGSEWNHVVAYNEGFGRTPSDNFKWLYTAITRASEKVDLVV